MGIIGRRTGPLCLLSILGAGILLQGCGGMGQVPGEGEVEAETTGGIPLTPEQLELSDMTNSFMEALSARDVDRLEGMLAPGAMLYSIRESEAGPSYGVRTREEFLGGLAEGGSPFRERIWDPVVEVRGRTGMVWAPYDFHLDGSFSHCGIDVLTFLRLTEGWKVTSITYDVVRDDCEPSPLGEPGD